MKRSAPSAVAARPRASPCFVSLGGGEKVPGDNESRSVLDVPYVDGVGGGGVRDTKTGCRGIGSNMFGSREIDYYKDHGDESVVVKTLAQMSHHAREFLYDDIHGVSKLPEETEEFQERKIQFMKSFIRDIPPKPAYNLARFLDPSSVSNRDILLMMLRAENYHTARAAKRLVDYFSLKLDLFGVDKLVHPIRLCDLTPEMFEMHRKCPTRMCKKDRSGRVVIFSTVAYHAIDWKSYFGSIFFLYMDVLLRDEAAQKNGFVAVLWCPEWQRPSVKFAMAMTHASRFFRSMPIKIVSYHVGFQEHEMRNEALGFVSYALGNYARLRVRTCRGGFVEYCYNLLSFGITRDMLPTDDEGNVDMEEWVRALERKRLEIEEPPLHPQQIIPTSRDCLLGKGHPFQKFVGNQYLSATIEHNRARHKQSERKQKIAITMAIVRYIKGVRGGRFLRRVRDDSDGDGDGERWVEVSDTDARGKIAHDFRSVACRDMMPCRQIGTFKFEDTEITVIETKDSA